MARKSSKSHKKRYPDTFRYVFLTLWAKDLDPQSVTRVLGIEPDSTCKRGFLRDKDGKVIVGKNGEPKRYPAGNWILDDHVHGNSGFETRAKDILERIKPKKAALRRVLKKAKAVLTIVVEPHEDICVRSLFFPANILNEFTSLGIDIEFCVDIPQNWAEFWHEVATRKIRRKKRKQTIHK